MSIVNCGVSYAILEEMLKKVVECRYGEEKRIVATERLDHELSIIKDQETSDRFLILSDAFNAVGATAEEFFLRGTTGSLIVAYLLGFSCADPLDEKLPLYAEVCLGADGKRKPEIELDVSPELLEKLVAYFCEKYGRNIAEGSYYSASELMIVKIRMGKVLKNDQDFYINLIPEEHADLAAEIREHEFFKALRPGNPVELVRCYGLMHGTGTYGENAETLLNDGIASLEDIIADREDVYEMMLKHGINAAKAYDIMEYVRKGRAEKNGLPTDMIYAMKKAGIPEWYAESCQKISYLFPRAHAINMLKYCKLL